MSWLQLSCPVTAQTLSRVEDAVMLYGAVSVTYMDAEDNPVLEPAPGETPLWDHVNLIALFPADASQDTLLDGLISHLGDDFIAEKAIFETLPDRDWERAWMDDFQPMCFGQRLWIVPLAMTPPDSDGVNLRLDPGLAFGTGTHPTTALCLQWLDGVDLTGKTVIDYGCGSGVLAIAALLLGAEKAYATDIDPQALQATRANAEVNGVSERLEVCLPDVMPEIQADLLMANILQGPLIELAPTLERLVAVNGAIVLSGLLEQQGAEVEACYSASFKMESSAQQEEWLRLTGVKILGEQNKGA